MQISSPCKKHGGNCQLLLFHQLQELESRLEVKKISLSQIKNLKKPSTMMPEPSLMMCDHIIHISPEANLKANPMESRIAKRKNRNC